MKNYFITATDTDAGKTFVACALTQAFVNLNKKVAVYKPISAGCQQVNGLLINNDAKLLSEFANCDQNIREINPIAFKEPIAPHIAAARVNRELCLNEIEQGFDNVLQLKADINLTEGAGGWRLPLNTFSVKSLSIKARVTKPIFLSDFAVNTKQDIILVVNMKLGCLNHALLTYQTIIADGLNCIGWVANSASKNLMSNLDDNIESLEQLLPIPKLAQLNYYSDTQTSVHSKICTAAHTFDLTPLLA
ncbi:dethiobiotin synthase [Colwellia sp. MSW7]|uniref:ATP-dependent dethiobiotin synthetase BioD n=1 Tax=Colwellia maritima TaxID=2912588 RepID=A0ABS9X1Y9_9GAMM|nr:dethiobiotin synthase [Colwellia maritima]MCI2284278.1 dethiobiotin synthase [Colwellia maritima]